jgi:prephenate dehydrogenase
VTLDGDDLVDQLLAVGAAGGHVSAIQRPESGLIVRASYPTD